MSRKFTPMAREILLLKKWQKIVFLIVWGKWTWRNIKKKGAKLTVQRGFEVKFSKYVSQIHANGTLNIAIKKNAKTSFFVVCWGMGKLQKKVTSLVH